MCVFLLECEPFKVSNNSFISMSLVSGMEAGWVVAQQMFYSMKEWIEEWNAN